jgi:hypothetical protein
MRLRHFCQDITQHRKKMMSEVDKAFTYIFWLSIVLIFVAYYAGSVQVIGALGGQLGNTILAATGRQTQGPNAGQFAAYPANAPTS